MRGQGARLIIWFQMKTRQQSVCGCLWCECGLNFTIGQARGKILKTLCSVSSLDPWTYSNLEANANAFAGWVSSVQVQDSQCGPLASACEGKYRYCVAPCHCLTMSEALRKVSLQVQRTRFKTAGGSMFSQRVTCHNMFEIASVGSGAPLSPLL